MWIEKKVFSKMSYCIVKGAFFFKKENVRIDISV